MNLFQKGINLVKDFFSFKDTDKRKVESITVKPTAQIPVAKTITPTKPVPTAKSMTFPVGEGLSNVTKVLPGPRIATAEAIKRGEEIQVVKPGESTAISPKTIAKTIVGKQPDKDLYQNVKEVAGTVKTGALDLLKTRFKEDLAMSPIERIKYNTALPFRIGKEIIKVLPMIPGFIAKEGVSAFLSAAAPEKQIDVPELKLFFGEEPVKSFQTRYAETNKMIKDLGGTDDQAKNLAVIGVGLATLSDLYVGGGGKKALEQKIMKEIEDVVKDKVTREFIQREAQRIAKLPKEARQGQINEIITSIMDDGSDAFKFAKEARQITDAEYKIIPKNIQDIKTDMDAGIDVGLKKFTQYKEWEKKQGIIKEIESPLAQEATKYKSAEEFVNKQFQSSNQEILYQDIRQLAREVKTPEQVDKAVIEKFGTDPEITLYRGVNEGLRPSPFESDITSKVGRFWSPNKAHSELFVRENGKMYEVKVKASDLLKSRLNKQTDLARGEIRLSSELQKSAKESPTKSQLTDIWNKANKGEEEMSKIESTVNEFKKIPKGEKIENPQNTLNVIDIPENISNELKLTTPKVIITRQSLKHIVEKESDDIVQAIPKVISEPTKIVDNSAKTPNSYLFARKNGKNYGVVLEVIKTPEGNRVVTAYRIDNKTYNKLKDISGGTAGALASDGSLIRPAAASRLGQETQFSALQKSSESIIPQAEKGVKVGSIGLDKFNVDDKTKQGIIKMFQDAGITDKIPQTEKQWLDAAKESEVLQKAITPEEVIRANGAMLKTEQRIATIEKELQQTKDPAIREKLLRESLELAKVLDTELSSRGRLLRAAKTGIEGEETIMGKIINDISKHGVDIDKVVEAGKNVDFNNEKEVVDFYRKFVKPKFFDVLTEYRYNNMLSNPRTQGRNLFSNIAQAILTRPLVKAVTAGIDIFTSLLTGKQREAFFKDVPKYYYGLVKSIPEAFSEFGATMMGRRTIGQQDLKQAFNSIPTGKLPGFFTIPSRTLEAVDRMMQTLIIGGETAAGKTVNEAKKIAEYSLFRSGLDIANKTGQGKLLSAIDNITSKIDFLRKVPGGTWFIPFLRTPMNFAKMWLEYSPVGLFTMIGSQRKKEQLAKAMIGSAITAYGAQLAFEDKTTWGVPKDPEAKQLFYASGKKPFSVKIGDNWVPMMYLGPWAFALALPAAIKYHNEDDPGALTESGMEKIGKDLSALAYFYSQQTFMSGIGSFVELFGGDPDVSVSKNLAFTAGQVIPFQGLVRYVSTIVDPVYRKSNTFLEAVESGIPYMSKDLEPHTLPTGEVSERNKWSYLAPYDITQERPEYDNMLKLRNQELQSNAVRNEMDKETQKKALKIVEILFSAQDDKTIIDALTPMKGNPGLKSAVKSMIKKQANYQAGTVQPYMILEPTDRAELIHTKLIMANKGGKKEEAELIDMLNDFKEANMWTEKEREALRDLLKKYPIEEVEQPNLQGKK